MFVIMYVLHAIGLTTATTEVDDHLTFRSWFGEFATMSPLLHYLNSVYVLIVSIIARNASV
jgi:hypothetical protein